ncbi:MAG: hypothetical protein GY835_16580 [bacterium]|nr:hypothetical protein [bacterium]
MDQLAGSIGGQPQQQPPPPPPPPTLPPQLPPQDAAAMQQITPPPADESPAVVATGTQPAEMEQSTGDVTMGDESGAPDQVEKDMDTEQA